MGGCVPFCEIVKICPPIIIVPVRGPPPELFATLKLTRLFPLPLAADVIVIQLSLLVADQLQPVEVKLTFPLPPDAVKLCELLEIVCATSVLAEV